MTEFRKRLVDGLVHLPNRDILIKENAYFNSLSPKSPFKKVGDFFKENIVSKGPGVCILFAVLAIILAPITFWAFIIFICAVVFTNHSKEWEDYDYRHRIAEPTLKLFDDKLLMTFHYDSKDLTDSGISYDDALVESHLVRPFNSDYKTDNKSECSYDWGNVNDADAFEFLGRRIYREWVDSDGDSHEEVFFYGSIYKFYTDFTVNGSINIMSTNTKQGLIGIEKEKNIFKPIKDKEIVVIDTENADFAASFDVVASYDEEAYRYLTPTRIEKLLELRKTCFFSICIKGNVMTVAVDDAYKSAAVSAFSADKPCFSADNPKIDLDNRIDRYRNAMLSIYELKDILTK
ncbi:MAG: DUF3137 domain-containing protein [Lachnospiraceae bacterium]|nr:DUF3137 domain-containing protein [Lachnospiraceae bacterium]